MNYEQWNKLPPVKQEKLRVTMVHVKLKFDISLDIVVDFIQNKALYQKLKNTKAMLDVVKVQFDKLTKDMQVMPKLDWHKSLMLSSMMAYKLEMDIIDASSNANEIEKKIKNGDYYIRYNSSNLKLFRPDESKFEYLINFDPVPLFHQFGYLLTIHDESERDDRGKEIYKYSTDLVLMDLSLPTQGTRYDQEINELLAPHKFKVKEVTEDQYFQFNNMVRPNLRLYANNNNFDLPAIIKGWIGIFNVKSI